MRMSLLEHALNKAGLDDMQLIFIFSSPVFRCRTFKSSAIPCQCGKQTGEPKEKEKLWLLSLQTEDLAGVVSAFTFYTHFTKSVSNICHHHCYSSHIYCKESFRANEDLLCLLELYFGLLNLECGSETWDSCPVTLTDLLIAEYFTLNKCSHSFTFNQPVDYLVSALHLGLLAWS